MKLFLLHSLWSIDVLVRFSTADPSGNNDTEAEILENFDAVALQIILCKHAVASILQQICLESSVFPYVQIVNQSWTDEQWVGAGLKEM